MPIHDWTRVTAGTWHDMHHNWTGKIRDALNGGLLPKGYYVQSEQIVGDTGPDLLTLEHPDDADDSDDSDDDDDESDRSEPDHDSGFSSGGGVATLTRPAVLVASEPMLQVLVSADEYAYANMRRRIAIRHASGDRVVALLELVSPGNKSAKHALRSFVEKAVTALEHRIHLTIVDLFPPTPRDPQGIHAEIWRHFDDAETSVPPADPLTLVAYDAAVPLRAHLSMTAVSKVLPDLPIFLKPGRHILCPMEATYEAAYRGVPQRWKTVLEK